MRSKQQPRPSYRWNKAEENDDGEGGVNVDNNDAATAIKDELSTGSVSPSSVNSLEISEVKTTTTSSMIKSRATAVRSKNSRNKLAAQTSLLLSRHHNTLHDDLEQNIPVTLIDHETGFKR
ncbi:unnamed protein product [Diamesa serratosioi]